MGDEKCILDIEKITNHVRQNSLQVTNQINKFNHWEYSAATQNDFTTDLFDCAVGVDRPFDRRRC